MTAPVQVPFVNLGLQYRSLRSQILERFDAISSRGSYILGSEVHEFEKAFAHYCGVSHAISVNSGGDALFLALKALDIGPGDEVITAPNSFVASAWAIAHTGAKIVFADVDDSYNIDPKRVAELITSKTKAIMPVHLTGRPAAMNELKQLALAYALFVVEDAAQAVGASYHGVKAGALGDIGCFSLHPLKNLHVHGDGGIITTNNGDHAARLIKLRNHGLVNRDECEEWGYNSRLDTIQAAIALLKLPHLDKWKQRFQEIANRYIQSLKPYLSVPTPEHHESCIFHRFVVVTPFRDALSKFLLERGIETKINYPIPLHLQPAALPLSYSKGHFPVTERLAETILSLPIYAEMPDEHVTLVIDGVIEFFKTTVQ